MKKRILLMPLLVTLLAGCEGQKEPEHKHEFEEKWTYNSDFHWHKATCGHDVKDSEAPHVFNANNVCETCGYTLVLPHTHTYVEHAKIDATCETAGNEKYYTCECGKIFNESKTEINEIPVIAAKGHTYGNLIPEVPAGCETEGVKEHYHCSVCNKDFDSNKKAIIDLTIPAKGHTYEEKWSNDETHHWHASNCGHDLIIDKAEHIDIDDDFVCDVCNFDLPKVVKSVELNETYKLIEVDETFELYATVKPENAENKNVSWSIADESVVKFENNVVTALKTGKTGITVTTEDQGKTATCIVEVMPKPIHVESVSLNKEDIILEIGKTEALVHTVLPEDASNKEVKWVSDDNSIATVQNGVITGVNSGSTDIYVIANDGNISASCTVNVFEPVVPPTPGPDETKVSTLVASKFAKSETTPLNTDVDYINFNFEKADGTYTPGYFEGKGGSFKIYEGNKLTISSSKGNISKINFAYNADKNSSSLPLVSDVGTVNSDYTQWIGNAKSVVLSTGSGSGSKAFATIEVTYTTSAHHEEIDLGYKSIKEVKNYIYSAAHSETFEVNKYGMGVDLYTTVTIKGLAMAKLGLSKTSSKYGYNITEPNKVVIGDDTDAIAVASKTGDGTLYGKVSNHQMKETTKYTVKGYISMNLGVPELICTEYQWNEDQSETANIANISKGAITLSDFYAKANAVNYNISGFGYGETYTLKGLTCYYSEADGQGKTWYNFTDGINNIRVNAYNINRISVGGVYDVTGMISLANYSPIIVAFEFKSSSATAVNLNEFYKLASEMSIANLKKINYVNDTEEKYPDMINNFSKIYKTTGYITTVQEGGKYYLGISDTYIDRADFLTGKGYSSVNNNLALIKNDNFWNLDDPYFKFNPYLDVTDENIAVTVYYTPRQSAFYNGKMYWEILLIPQSIPEIPAE